MAVVIMHPWARDDLRYQAWCKDCNWNGTCGTEDEAKAEASGHVCKTEVEGGAPDE